MSRSLFTLRHAACPLALATALCAPVVLLSACGGGGGGSAEVVTPAATAVAITATNQKLVAADALDNSTDVETARSSSSLLTGVQVDTGGTGGSLLLADVARVLLGKVPAKPALATGVQLDATSVNCDFDGTMTMSATGAPGTVMVAGDIIKITAFGCKESVDGVTTTMNGNLEIRIVSGSMDLLAPAFPLRMTMAMTATNLSVATAARTETSNGDMLIEMNETSPTVSSGVVSGNSLTNSVATSTGTRSVTLKNYRQQVSVNNGAATFDVSATVEAANGRLGSGTVSYAVTTLAPLVTNSAGDYTSGSLKMVGANNASLVLTVSGTNTFELKLDENGDSVFEATSTVSRDALEALL